MTENDKYHRKVHNDGKRITLPIELQNSEVITVERGENGEWIMTRTV